MGAVVTQAVDGRDGFDAALTGHFDLIITDIEMPGMDGFEVCQKLKQSTITRSIPVIILSIKEDEEYIERGFRLGASAYVTKANAKHELRERIEDVLNRNTLLRGRTILIVDDSRSIRRVIGDALSQAGFQVVSSGNGREALGIMESIKPDLILSDLNMPEMNGFQFCKIIRTDPNLSEIPFIIMSAASDRATMRRMLQQGASAFLVKPFNIDQLVITAEKLLSDYFGHLIKEKERLDSERSLMLASIASLVLALEARDQYTRGHSDAVARIVVGMAQRMGFDAQEVEKIRIAGKLHDLGKIGIRDEILLKPGPLTREEYATIKRHPTIGAEILTPIPSLTEIIPAIANHHERIDGKGYPQGLKGSKIPLLARMIAVADTFHALTSDRPYRKGYSLHKALQILEEIKNTQLCPECVGVFLEWINLERDN
jgi:putative nucleotidyltransferase with HDIG domain